MTPRSRIFSCVTFVVTENSPEALKLRFVFALNGKLAFILGFDLFQVSFGEIVVIRLLFLKSIDEFAYL